MDAAVEQYVLIPCTACGVPYLTLDSEQWHRDPCVQEVLEGSEAQTHQGPH